MKLVTHSDKSLSTRLFVCLIKPYWRLLRKGSVARSGSQCLKPRYCASCDVTERKLDGIYTYDMVMKGGTTKPTKRVI